MREEARSLFLTKKSKTLLNSDDLKNLWALLEKHAKDANDENRSMLPYEAFLKIRFLGGEKLSKYLSTSVFMRLLAISSSNNSINVVQLFNYIMRKVCCFKCVLVF